VPLGPLLERYVARILAIEPPPVSASVAATRAWRSHVRSHTVALIDAIRSRDDEDRGQIAARLAQLPDRDRVWGIGRLEAHEPGLPGDKTGSAGK
jgi:hypothetical protein